MELLELATGLLTEKLGLEIDPQTLQSALSGLLGDGQGNIDFAGLASKMASSGELGNVLGSWLGDGANSAISAESIQSLLGEDRISEFASQVGTGSGAAAAGLADVLPQLMDKASSGGNLLDSLGGAGGLLGAASSLFK